MQNHGTFTDAELEIHDLEWEMEETRREGLLTPALERWIINRIATLSNR